MCSRMVDSVVATPGGSRDSATGPCRSIDFTERPGGSVVSVAEPVNFGGSTWMDYHGFRMYCV